MIVGTFIGGSPALIVESGIVFISNSTFTNATDSPTILVTGGSLKLRNDTVQESTGYNQAAIQITGGSVDLGTAAVDPGGNILNINGMGQFIVTSTPNAVSAYGNTLKVDGVARNAAPVVASIDRTTLSGAPSNAHSVTYTVTFSDFVIGVDASDFQLNKTGSLATTSTQVTPISGSVYVVTVSGITGDGQLRLDLVDDFSIHDLAGNRLAASALFENQQTYAAGKGPLSLLMGDININHQVPSLLPSMDRNLDIVLKTSVQGGPIIGLMLGNDDGSFRNLMTIGPETSYPPQQIVDFDSDGIPDILFLLGSSSQAIVNNVAVMRGNGDGTFQSPTIISNATNVGSAMLTDVTGDSIPDLILRSDVFANSFVRVQVGNSDHSFQSPKTFTTGNSPYSIAIADVNGDQKPDLVVGNRGSGRVVGSVGILIGIGDGTFQNMQTVGTGSHFVNFVTVTDLNHDDSPDLLVDYFAGKTIPDPQDNSKTITVEDRSVHNLGVFLGDGFGAFQDERTTAVETTADTVAVADFDGNSFPDLVYPNGQGAVSVLLGRGDGYFKNAQFYAAGISTQSAVVADVNHDGKPDIVVANYWHDIYNIGNNIGVFLNAVHGNYVGQFYNLDTTPPLLTLPPDQTFESFSTQPLTVHYVEATATDAVSANVTITYSVPQDMQLPIGTTVISATATDAVGNQTIGTFRIIVLPPSSPSPFVVSIASSTPISNGIAVYTVTFSQSVIGVDVSDFQLVRTDTVEGGTIQFTPVSGSVYIVTVSGVTGNGTLVLNLVDDGSIHNQVGRPLSRQNVSSNFYQQAIPNTGLPSAVADVNGDGKGDLVIGNSVRLNTTPTGAITASFAPGQTISTIAPSMVTDVNGDGKPDLVFLSTDPQNVDRGYVGVRLNTTPSGATITSFSNEQSFSVGVATFSVGAPRSVNFADINGDGKPDLVILGQLSSVSVLVNTTPSGSATLAFSSEYLINLSVNVTGTNIPFVVIADINGDSKPDIVFRDFDHNSIVANLNHTTADSLSPNFDPPLSFAIGSAFSANRNLTDTLAAGDINSDGKLDLVAAIASFASVSPPSKVAILRNDSAPGAFVSSFAPTQFFTNLNAARSVGLTDINSDGKPDVVLYAGTLSVQLNTTPTGFDAATFSLEQAFNVGRVVSSVPGGVTDMNGDGKPDIVCITSESGGNLDTIGVFLNAYNASFSGLTYIVSSIRGTAGNDTIVINPGTAPGSVKATVNGVTQDNIQLTESLQILGLAGNDTITINASLASGMNIDGGEDADTVIINAGNLTGAVSVADSGSASNVDSLNVNGTAGNDTFTKSLSQLIVVSTSTATINYAGNEQFTMDGKSGDDSYTVDFGGTAQTMTAVADSGLDIDFNTLTVNGTSSDDFLYKNSGFVQWKPLGGASFIQRLDFSNIDLTNLLAGDGNDTIHDPGASTQIFGGRGDDTIIIDATTGTGVSAFGGEGNDSYIINLGSLAGPVTVTDSAGSNTVQVIGTPGNDDLKLTSTATSSQLATGTGEIISLNVGGATATALKIDGGGGTNSVTLQGAPPPVQVTATHVAPVMGMITAPVDPKQVSTIINVSASFTDMDLGDRHTAVWNWGDGTSTSTGPTIIVTEPSSSAPGSVTGSHVYSSAGVYIITLTVTDMYGASAKTVFQYIVIYDPSAGFVTGGGWINSPAGAYAANVLLTGKANFGFESKYNNGNSVPTGNTEFQFSVANFKFKSTAYEWLVVSGAKARYRGTGTVNGAGSYGFELTAWDGQVSGGGGVDKFRIKIWNKNLGNGVVYDNMMNAADGADPTTALGGGSIVIHKSGSNLVLSAGVNGTPSGSARLTDSQLSTGLADAIAAWETQDLTSTQLRDLQGLTVSVADLPGNLLGLASESTNYVWIDADAAGYGWSFSTEDLRSGGVDLLSVLTHELGHKLGYDHDVMGESLNVGERHLAMQTNRVIPYYAELSKLVKNGLGTLIQQQFNRDVDSSLDIGKVRSSSTERNDKVDQSLKDWSDDNSWAVGSNGYSILDEPQSLRGRKTLWYANDKLNEDLLDELWANGDF